MCGCVIASYLAKSVTALQRVGRKVREKEKKRVYGVPVKYGKQGKNTIVYSNLIMLTGV